ncbi:MAG TPA: hypothetical protein VH062_16650 [Polyangiaceae bacterium]|nr:hypothetical protein [Polyangiaceae bacterium]
MTTPADEEHGLEQRALSSRARLLETIDALERRGQKLVATAHEFKNLAALAVDGVAVLGALSSLFALIRAATPTRRLPSSTTEPARSGSGIVGKLALFAVFAGVAYAARKQLGSRRPARGAPAVSRGHLRAM